MHKKFQKFGKESSHKKLKCKKKHAKDKSTDRYENRAAIKIKIDKKRRKYEDSEKEYLKNKHKEKKKRKLLERLEKHKYVEQYLQNLNTNAVPPKNHHLQSLDRETTKNKQQKQKLRKEKTIVEPDYNFYYRDKKHEYTPDKQPEDHQKYRKRKSSGDKHKHEPTKGMNSNVFYCQIQPTPQVVANTKNEFPPANPRKKERGSRHNKKSSPLETPDKKMERSPSRSSKQRKMKLTTDVASNNFNKPKGSHHSLGEYEEYFAFEEKSHRKPELKHVKRESSERREKDKRNKIKTQNIQKTRLDTDDVEEKLKQKLEEDIKHYFSKIQTLIDKKLDGILCTRSKMKLPNGVSDEVKETHQRSSSRRSQSKGNNEGRSKLLKKRSQSKPTKKTKYSTQEESDQHQLRRYKSPLPQMTAQLTNQQAKVKPRLALVPSFQEIRTRHYNSLSSLQKSSEQIQEHFGEQNKFIVEGVEPPNFESSKGKQRPRPKTQINLECKTISIFGIPSTITKDAIIAVNQTQTSNSLNIQKRSEEVVEERKKTRRFKAYYKYSVGDTAKHSSDSSEIKSIVSDSHRAISDPSDVEEMPIKQPKVMQITIPEYYFKKRKHRIVTPVDSKLKNISEETSNDSSKKNKAKKKDQVECKYFRTLPSSTSDYSFKIVPKSGHSDVSIQSRGGHKKSNFTKYFTRQINILSSVSTVNMAKSVSNEVIKLYRSISDMSNDVRARPKEEYYSKEVRNIYEAKPNMHNIKKNKYFEEVDRYFDRRKFLRDIAKKIEDEEKYARKEEHIKENIADLFLKEFIKNDFAKTKQVSPPKEEIVEKKPCGEIQKDQSSKEGSKLMTKSTKSSNKKTTSKDVAVEVTGPVLPISVDVGVEVSPRSSKTEKATVETRDACIGVTPKTSPRVIKENVEIIATEIRLQDVPHFKKENSKFMERQSKSKNEKKVDDSSLKPTKPNASPRVYSPMKKQLKNTVNENKPTLRSPDKVIEVKKSVNESMNLSVDSPKSKINLNAHKSKSKHNLALEKSKPNLQNMTLQQNIRPCSANAKSRKASKLCVIEKAPKTLIRSSSLVVISSQKKCVALNTSKSEVAFKESKIASLVCIDKYGMRSKFAPRSITEHSLDRFASSTSSNRFFGSSRLYTKDYKGNNDISSYQRRKIYDEEMRKKNRKKIQRENTNPQIFEVRYLTTTVDEIVNTEEVIKQQSCVDKLTETQKKESAHDHLVDGSDEKAFQLFKSFLIWNQQKNPSQFCDNCAPNKNLESMVEFLYKYTSCKQRSTALNQNKEEPCKKIQKPKLKNRDEIATKKETDKPKVVSINEEPKKDVKKTDQKKPEIINYFPQESRSKMYHQLKKKPQELEKKTSCNSDDDNAEEIYVTGPTSLPKFETQDSSFEFMYENECIGSFSKQSAISLLTSLQVPQLQRNLKQFNVEIEATHKTIIEDVESPKSCSEESGYSSVVSRKTNYKRDFFKIPSIAALFNCPDDYLVSASDNSIEETLNDGFFIKKIPESGQLPFENKTSIVYEESQYYDFDLEAVSENFDEDRISSIEDLKPPENSEVEEVENSQSNFFPIRNLVYAEMSKSCQLYAQKVRENSQTKDEQLPDYQEIPLDVLLSKNSSISILPDDVSTETKSMESVKVAQEEIIDCKIVLSNESLRTDSVTFLTDVFSQKVLPHVTEDCEKIQLDVLCHNLKGKDSLNNLDDPNKLKQFMAKKFFRNLLSVYEKEMDISKKLCEDKCFENQLLESIGNLELNKIPKKGKKSIKSFFKKFKGQRESKEDTRELEDVRREVDATVGKYLDETHQLKLRKLAYDARRYFTMFVQAVKVNQNINDEMKICGLLKLLQRIERGDFTVLRKEEEVNFEQEIKEQIKHAFVNVYEVSSNEAKKFNRNLTKEDIQLIRTFVSKYRIGLLSKTDIIASYIGRGVIKSEKQLKAAVTYLMRSQTTDIDLQNFEEYCKID